MQIPGPKWRTPVVGSWDLYFHIPTTPQVIFLFSNVWKPLLFWDWCLLHGNNRKPSIRKVENWPRDQPLVHGCMPSYFCLALIKLSNAWFIAHLVFYFEWLHVLGLFWGYWCYSPSSTLSPSLSISFFIPATDSWYLCMFHYLLVTPELTLIALHIRPPLLVSLGINLLHSCSWEHVGHCLPSVWPVMPGCGPRYEEWSVLCSLIFPVHGLYWITLILYAFPTLQILSDTSLPRYSPLSSIHSLAFTAVFGFSLYVCQFHMKVHPTSRL